MACEFSTPKLLDTEVEMFGLAHTAVGNKCGESWELPDEISDVITFHHNPSDSDFGSDLVKVVCAANQLTRIWGVEHADPEAPEAQSVLLSIDIDMSPEDINSLKEQAETELTAVRDAGGG